MKISVWCVRHEHGTCAAATNRKWADGVNSVKTKCGCQVILPWGCEQGEPTCEACLDELRSELAYHSD